MSGYFVSLDDLPFPVEQGKLNELVLSLWISFCFTKPLTPVQMDQLPSLLEEWSEEVDLHLSDEVHWVDLSVVEVSLNTGGIMPEFGADLRTLLLEVHEVSPLERVELGY